MCVYFWSLDLSVFTRHFQEEEEENDALVQEVEKTNEEEEETNWYTCYTSMNIIAGDSYE